MTGYDDLTMVVMISWILMDTRRKLAGLGAESERV